MNSNELNTIFTNTADSLRAKLGSTEKYKPETFSNLVDSLEVKQYPLIGNIFANLTSLSSSQSRFYLMDGYTGEQPTKFKLTKKNFRRQVSVLFDKLDKYTVADGNINGTMQNINNYILLGDNRVLYRTHASGLVVGCLTNGLPLGETPSGLSSVNLTLDNGVQIPSDKNVSISSTSYGCVGFVDYDNEYFFLCHGQKDSGYSVKTGNFALYKVRKSDLTIVATSGKISTNLASSSEPHMVMTIYNNKVFAYFLHYGDFDELIEFTTSATYVSKKQMTSATSGRNWFHAYGQLIGKYWLISGSMLNRCWEIVNLETKTITQFEVMTSNTEISTYNFIPNITMNKMYVVKKDVPGLYEVQITSDGRIDDSIFIDANKVADGSFSSITNIATPYSAMGTATGTARFIEGKGLILFGLYDNIETGLFKLVNIPEGYLDGIANNITRTANMLLYNADTFKKETYIYPTDMLDREYSADGCLNLVELGYDSNNNFEYLNTEEAAYLNYDDNGKFNYVAKIAVTRENNASAARSATPCVLSTPYVYYKGNKYTLKYYTNKTATPTDLTSVSSLY